MRVSRVSVLLLLVLLAITVFRFISLPTSVLSKVELPVIMAILVVTLLTTFLCREKQRWMKKRYLTVSNIFFLSFLIVHFQEYIDLLVIPNYSKELTIYNDQFITVKTAYISLLGAIAYCLGYSISRLSQTIWRSKKDHWHINYRTLGKYSTFCYFILLILFIIVNGRTYLSGAYSQETLVNMSGSLGTYTVILMSACSLTTVLSVCLRFTSDNQSVSLRKYLMSFSPFFYICVIIYIFFVISFGDRGPVIMAVMTFAGGYFLTSKKRISVFYLIIILFIAATVISVWGLMRSDRGSGISFRERTDELYSSEQTLSPATAELAGSNRVAIMAVESTPSQFPYRYGLFTFNNLISIIPFSSSLVRAFGLNVPKNLAHSSAFMNWYDHGDRVAAGVGTTTVADIYLDFGWIGVVIVLLLLGLLFRRIDASVYASPITSLSPFLVISFIVLFSQAVYIPRSVTLFQLRNIVWDYAIFMLFCFVSRKNV